MDSGKKKLKSSDGKEREVDKTLLEKSKLLKGLLEDYQGEDDVIPLNEVDDENLNYVMQYLEHYKDKEPKEYEKPFPENADDAFLKSIYDDDWTYNFVKQTLGIEKSINLINAANYLQIDGLISVLAGYLGWELTNCSVEEAKKKFQIEDDMTEEEKAEYDKYPLD